MAPPPKSTIYTKRGDSGQTSLISGTRVSKNHPRLAAYGTIDELNSAIGVATSFVRDVKVVTILQSIQNELFNIGAELASPNKLKKEGKKGFYELSKSKVEDLERLIDQYDLNLTKLRTFILPSGAKGASLLHLARTVCRRAEREGVALAGKENI